MVAEELDKFMQKVESQRGTDSHPIMLVTQMLQMMPTRRPWALEALQHPWLEALIKGGPEESMSEAAEQRLTNELHSPNSGEPLPGPLPKQQASEAVALQQVPLLSSGGHAPEPHPKLSILMKVATLLPHLVPGDLQAFLRAVRLLGCHEGNLLLHSILVFTKYPTVVEDIAPRLAKLPMKLKAQVGASSASFSTTATLLGWSGYRLTKSPVESFVSCDFRKFRLA